MHALPEKLKVLENTLESSFRRRLVEQRLFFEKDLRDSCVQAEENAIRRTREAFDERLGAIEARLDGELPAVRAHLDKVIEEFKASTGKLSEQIKKREEAMTAEVISLQAEVPTVHARLRRMEEDMREFAHVRPDLTKAIDGFRESLEAVDEDIRLAGRQEADRAKAAEAEIRHQLTQFEQASGSATKAVEEEIRTQAAKLVRQSVAAEERLRSHMEKIAAEAKQARDRIELEASEARQPLQEGIQELRTRLEEYRGAAREHANSTETKLADAIKESCERVESSCNELARSLVDAHRLDASAEVAVASKVAAGERAASDNMHTEAVASVRQEHEDKHRTLEVELQLLREAMLHMEERGKLAVAEASHTAEQRLIQTSDEVQAKLRAEKDDTVENIIKGREEVAKMLREEMEWHAARCRDHAQSVGKACDEVANGAIADMAKTLRDEASDSFKTAYQRIDAERQNVASKLREEQDTRARAIEASFDLHKMAVQDASVELSAKIAAHGADLSMRLEGVRGRTEEAHEKAREIRAALDGQMRALEFVDKAWREQLKEATGRLDAADEQAHIRSEAFRSQAATNLKTEASMLQEKLFVTSEAFAKEIRDVRVELKDRAVQRDVSDHAAAFAKVTAELGTRLGSAETVLDRQRERVELVFREMQDRVDSAHTESSDAKAMMQHTTSTLGTELSTVRAAATSLTHGVLRALQVIGLLHSEIDVVPARTHDGRGPSVPRRWGVEVVDLLDWEKSGHSLANRVTQMWQSIEPSDCPSLIAFVERKANAKDVNTISNTIRLVGAQFPKGASIYGQGGASDRAGQAVGAATAMAEDMCTLPVSGGHLKPIAQRPAAPSEPRAPAGPRSALGEGRTSPVFGGARKLSTPGGEPI